ncbi:transcriptional regulator of TetR family [Bosea sp. BIWAKO-01]|nr:transcriptional regulator of TetR family [Bosea sp. BIWAKO-01]
MTGLEASTAPPDDVATRGAVRQTRTKRRSEARRFEILAAAVSLFNEKGLRGTMLSDVAQAVGLSTNSLCYYFRKKDDLAAACFMDAIDILRAIVAKATLRPTPELRVREFASGFAARLAREVNGGGGKLVGIYDLRALVKPQSDVVFAAYNSLFREVRALLSAPDRPSPDRRQLNASAHLLLSLVHSMRIWIGQYAAEDYERVADHFCDVMVAGFAPSPGAWPPASLAPIAWPFEADAPSARDAFLRAATLTINEFGFSGASVDKISARLQLTKGAFYHHNDNKEGLFSECAARTFAVIREVQNEAQRQPTGWDELGSAITHLVRFQLSDRGPLLRATALSALPAHERAEMIDATNKLSERFVYPIVKGMADGSIRPLHPLVGSHLVSAMIYAATELPLWLGEISPDQAVDLYAKPLLLGVLAAQE